MVCVDLLKKAVAGHVDKFLFNSERKLEAWAEVYIDSVYFDDLVSFLREEMKCTKDQLNTLEMILLELEQERQIPKLI